MTIKDGDIFRWHYKDETPEQRREWGRYHCRSRIAVAKDGWLVDTFWTYGMDNPRRDDNTASWPYSDATEKLELTHVGNLADLEKQPEWMTAYYDDADIVNLNHSNSSRNNFYIRKGAQRSREKMLAVVAARIAETKRDISFRQDRLERDRKLQAELEAGRNVDDVYL